MANRIGIVEYVVELYLKIGKDGRQKLTIFTPEIGFSELEQKLFAVGAEEVKIGGRTYGKIKDMAASIVPNEVQRLLRYSLK